MSCVTTAEPSVPETNSGVARLVAELPKVFVKRAIFVGKIEAVPSPAIAAPAVIIQRLFPVTKTMTPAVNTIKLRKIMEFIFKRLEKNGATARPATTSPRPRASRAAAVNSDAPRKASMPKA